MPKSIPGEHRGTTRDTDLYQTLLGLTPRWEVTAVRITQPTTGRPLGDIAVAVQWQAGTPLTCPSCGSVAPDYDSRPRRWRHFNAMQWKTFITADVPRVNWPNCGAKQVRVTWAENSSRFIELFEALAIQVVKAVRSNGQAQGLTALSWDQVDRIMDARRLPGTRAPLARGAHLFRAR